METEQLYLIAHKVRGEIAFDIAMPLTIGEEDGWIIPTSGHRAFPFNQWKLEELADISDYPHKYPSECQEDTSFPSLPDHYPEAAAPKGEGAISGLFSKLGFKRTAVQVTRRI